MGNASADHLIERILSDAKDAAARIAADADASCAQIAAERDDIKVVSINIVEQDDLAYDYDVSSIPCLVVFKDGKEAKRSVGLKPKSEIIKLF